MTGTPFGALAGHLDRPGVRTDDRVYRKDSSGVPERAVTLRDPGSELGAEDSESVPRQVVSDDPRDRIPGSRGFELFKSATVELSTTRWTTGAGGHLRVQVGM